MAFPTIPTVAGSRILTAVQANTTATRTFPSLTGLTKNAGDLLIAICIAYQSSVTNAAFSGWTGGFTEFHDSSSSTTMAVGCAYKWSDGTETGTFAVTQAATITGQACFILMSIPGAHASTPPEAGSRASGTTAAADPAAFNPAGWNIEDALWIAVGGGGETSTTGSFTGVAATNPTNFTGVAVTAISADAVGGCNGAVAFRQDPVASENVGTFSVDVSSARNAAVVIAVRPAPTASQVLVTDSFDRVDSDAVGVDSNGNSWIERAGDWDISSNRVIQTDAATVPGALLCGTDMADNTHWVEGTVGSGDDGSDQIGLLVRLDQAAFTCLSFEVADGAYKLIEVSGGTPNTVFTGSAHTHQSGETYGCQIDTDGNIAFFLNGTQVASTTSAFNLGDTRVGFHINADVGTNTASWGNFRAGVGPYPGPLADTFANAEAATATGAGLDAQAEVIWPALLLMAPMVAP